MARILSRVHEQRESGGTLDHATARLGRVADAVIVVAYVIPVALYPRIMAQYIVGFFESAGSALLEPVIGCVAVAVIVAIGAVRGFTGLNRLDRVSLAAVPFSPRSSGSSCWSTTRRR